MLRQTRGILRIFALGVILLVIASVCFWPHSASAAINPQINFQGKLTNPSTGVNVANGSYSIVFSLYSVSSGGSAVWTETQNVTIANGNGIFNVALGSVTALPGSVDFNSADLYLGIKVGADAEMTPRIRFTAAPYAFNSDRLAGLTSNNFVQLAQGLQVDSSTTNASIAVNKTGATASLLDLQRNGATVFGISNSGSATFTATSAPTTDQVSITNAGQPVTAAGVNGLSVNYVGGNANVEASGLRIDHTPGGTSGGVWSGMRIVANATGPVSGVTSYGIKIEGPTAQGAGSEIGMRIASGFDIGADIASGGIQLADMDDPSTPAAGTLRVYAQTTAGRTLLKIRGPSGVSTTLQPSIFANKIGWWTAQGNGTTVTAVNFGNSVGGTATTRNVATTNLFTSTRRVGYVSAGTAGSSAGIRHNLGQFWAGNAAGLGGYYYVARAGISQTQANMRSFVGMSATTAALANANPSTLFNLLGFGCDTGDTQFTFMSNDGTGAATKTALTGAFPCNTANTDMYDFRVFLPPNDTMVYFSIERLNTGDFYEGSISANMPAKTTLMSPQVWINNGTTAAAVGVDVISQYIETDN